MYVYHAHDVYSLKIIVNHIDGCDLSIVSLHYTIITNRILVSWPCHVYDVYHVCSPLNSGHLQIDKKQMQAEGMVARVRKEVEIHSRLKHPAILEVGSVYMYFVCRMYFQCHSDQTIIMIIICLQLTRVKVYSMLLVCICNVIY